LRTQIAECHALIDKELEAGTERPARLTLLKVKLESLMELLRREDGAKEPVLPKVEVTSTTTSPDPLDEVVRGMLERHAAQPTASKTAMVTSTPVTMTRSEPVTRQVDETDEDLLT
jgi:hypothetical protein